MEEKDLKTAFCKNKDHSLTQIIERTFTIIRCLFECYEALQEDQYQVEQIKEGQFQVSF